MSLGLDPAVSALVGEAVGALIVSISIVTGGDVSDARRLELADGTLVFVKTHRSPPPWFFTTEAAGLTWLAECRDILIPACWR